MLQRLADAGLVKGNRPDPRLTPFTSPLPLALDTYPVRKAMAFDL